MAAHEAEVACDLHQPLDSSRTPAPAAQGPLQTLKALRLAMAMTQQAAKAADDDMVHNAGTHAVPVSISNGRGAVERTEGKTIALSGHLGAAPAPPHGQRRPLAAMHLHPGHAPPAVRAAASTASARTSQFPPSTIRPTKRGGDTGGSRGTSGGGSSSSVTTAASGSRPGNEVSGGGTITFHHR